MCVKVEQYTVVGWKRVERLYDIRWWGEPSQKAAKM